jgi:hypothetical protein
MTTNNTDNSLPSTILVCDDDRWGDRMFALRSWTELKNAFREMWSGSITEDELTWVEEDAMPDESGIYLAHLVDPDSLSDGYGLYSCDWDGRQFQVSPFEDGIAWVREWHGDDEEEEEEDA